MAMLRTPAAFLIAGLLAAGALAQEGTVHLRQADGSWQQIEAQVTDGAISFRLGPEQAPDGQATVVINKPDWMVLEDETPPRLTGVVIDGKLTELAGEIDLGGLAEAPKGIVFEIADEQNPLDPRSARITLADVVSAADVDTSRLGPPEQRGSFTVSLADLPPGAYAGHVEVADLSPQGNVARIPISFSIFGIQVSDDGQAVRLAGPGSSFEVNAHKQQFLRIGAGGPTMYLTAQNAGNYLYVREFTGVETIEDSAQAKAVRVSCSLQDIDDNPLETEAAATEVTYDLEVRSDLPCLLVACRAKNLGDKQSVYCFWGWPPGEGYVTPDGEHEWKMEYAEIGPVSWVYLPPTRPGATGLGWISPLPFGESRFGTMLLYTEPKHIETETDGVVEMQFAVMPAESAEQVATAADKLAEMGWGH